MTNDETEIRLMYAMGENWRDVRITMLAGPAVAADHVPWWGLLFPRLYWWIRRRAA